MEIDDLSLRQDLAATLILSQTNYNSLYQGPPKSDTTGMPVAW
jgi:hypothetical protein